MYNVELIDLPDHLVKKVTVDEYESIHLAMAQQSEEYSKILDTSNPDDIYPLVQEHVPNMDEHLAKEVILYLIPPRD